ncbi:MAG: hypothetical protein GC156_13960 [Actinomycetales bacterium]|nr:hypothetical protein [Actinomycetales bacterium]
MTAGVVAIGRDRGAALLMAVLLMQALMAVALGGLLVAGLAVRHAAVASVADLAALAAAEAMTDPCAAAEETALANGLELSACVIQGLDAVVTVAGDAGRVPARLLALLGHPHDRLEVTARAGPP